jgi:hypothetical protein
MFNYSIDAPDLYGDDISEDLSYNDIESITELVLEVFIGIENAVPEHDEDDSEDGSNFSKKFNALNFNKIVIEDEAFIFAVNTEHTFSPFQSYFENPYLTGKKKPPQA